MAVVLVSGALANKLENGGAAWTRLSWALGLKALGFEVAFLEQIRADCCVDRSGRPCQFETSANREYFRAVTDHFGLSDLATLTCDHGPIHGRTWSELDDLVGSAAALLNITGHCTHPQIARIPRRVYIDLDPGYTQFWHAEGNPGPRLEGHNFYYTVGENIGLPGCSIPTNGIPWRPIRQPAVLRHWPACPPTGSRTFSTIASWRGGYGTAQYAGRTYGLKAHEFRKFIELPRRARQRFEIALDINHADERDRLALSDHGWHIVEPAVVASGPVAFRQYVQSSGAEFSAAQGVYIETRSGWFSDRTVRYLSSGRPALVQDTGFSRNYPVGEGLLCFRTLDEAAAGAERIMRHYPEHCHAARAIAEEFFASDRVLSGLIEGIGLTA